MFVVWHVSGVCASPIAAASPLRRDARRDGHGAAAHGAGGRRRCPSGWPPPPHVRLVASDHRRQRNTAGSAAPGLQRHSDAGDGRTTTIALPPSPHGKERRPESIPFVFDVFLLGFCRQQILRVPRAASGRARALLVEHDGRLVATYGRNSTKKFKPRPGLKLFSVVFVKIFTSSSNFGDQLSTLVTSLAQS